MDRRSPASNLPPPRQSFRAGGWRMPAARHLQSGFTMAELVVVMVVGGILAAYAVPKISSILDIRDDAWRDELVSALRYAQKSAVAHRRLVCVTVSATEVSITAAVANPAVACTDPLTGPDGNAVFAAAGNSSANTAVLPAGVLYFQPDGRVTTDGAGAAAATRVISMSGASNVTVYGETGFVQ